MNKSPGRIWPRAQSKLYEEPTKLVMHGFGPALEFEQLLKIHFADSGTKADILSNLAATLAWARERNVENLAIGQAYLAGEGAFPHRAALNMVGGRFLTDFHAMVANWPNGPRASSRLAGRPTGSGSRSGGAQGDRGRGGANVVVAEKAPGPRTQGYMIDFFGPATTPPRRWGCCRPGHRPPSRPRCSATNSCGARLSTRSNSSRATAPAGSCPTRPGG
ncbi:hypothetical protein [Pseudonocardia sp. H11422]|uniref:hypothetical protein n=1 Tax=Pseudonocardia sp. H11422 TaxID=2835866 RepID=UPI001BDD8E10|nr:hypothetical protein [Pseudonocardia sp. H11422]